MQSDSEFEGSLATISAADANSIIYQSDLPLAAITPRPAGFGSCRPRSIQFPVVQTEHFAMPINNLQTLRLLRHQRRGVARPQKSETAFAADSGFDCSAIRLTIAEPTIKPSDTGANFARQIRTADSKSYADRQFSLCTQPTHTFKQVWRKLVSFSRYSCHGNVIEKAGG